MHQYLRLERRRHSRTAARHAARALEGAQAALFHLAIALCLAAAITWLALASVRAASDVVVDEGGDVIDVESPGSGMPRSNPRVKPILAAHPNQSVVVCVAGCGGKPRAVQVLPRTVSGRTGTFVPSAARLGNDVYGPPRPGSSRGSRAVAREDDVVCIAGCTGKPGQVLQQLPDLPPLAKPAPAKPEGKRDGFLDFLP